MNQIFNYVLTYGLPAFLIGLIIISIIGILKLCKAFDWIKRKNIKKIVYHSLNIILSFSLAAIYFAIFKLDFVIYVSFSLKQTVAATAMYALYENYNLRELWQMVLAWIASWFKRNPEHKYTKALKNLGLTNEAVERIQCLTDSELKLKENAENKTK